MLFHPEFLHLVTRFLSQIVFVRTKRDRCKLSCLQRSPFVCESPPSGQRIFRIFRILRIYVAQSISFTRST